MADDIVTRLRVIHCAADDLTPCGTCLTCRAAAEIERLRTAGDEVTRVLVETPCECQAKCWCGRDSAIHEWNEARRG